MRRYILSAKRNCQKIRKRRKNPCHSWCCTGFFIELDKPISKDMIKYYSLHGCTITNSSTLFVHAPCKWLWFSRDGVGKCMSYKSRPEFCKTWFCKECLNTE
jgi:hypothetical protein